MRLTCLLAVFLLSVSQAACGGGGGARSQTRRARSHTRTACSLPHPKTHHNRQADHGMRSGYEVCGINPPPSK